MFSVIGNKIHLKVNLLAPMAYAWFSAASVSSNLNNNNMLLATLSAEKIHAYGEHIIYAWLR